jgi:glucan phosphoethanolaminetransferase (alkaline phosphatase superfamily)
MPFFAVTAWEKMKSLPPDVWLKVVVAVAAFVVAVFIFRRVMKMNKIIAGVAIFVVTSVVFFSWVYNRNEPKFMTPLVERIAPFFPSANAYSSKQQTSPKP